MTRRIALSLTILLMLVGPLLAAQAPAQVTPPRPEVVAPYLDDQTFLVLRIDLAGLDAGLEQWLIEIQQTILKAEQRQDPQAVQAMQKDLQEARQWRDDMLKAGARELYWAVGMADLGPQPGVFVVPLEQAANAENVKQLMVSVIDRRAAAEQIDNAIVVASTQRMGQIKAGNQKPAARPELSAAFKATDNSAVQLALIPAADTRRVIEETMPTLPPQLGGGPSTVLTQGLQWLALSFSPPPQGTIEVFIQSKDAAAANALASWLAQAVASLQKQPGFAQAPAAAQEFLAGLKPTVAGDHLTLALNQQQTAGLMTILGASMGNARRSAQTVNSASVMRQLMMSAYAYRHKHGDWPADLPALARAQSLPPQMLVSPLEPWRGQQSYIYLKPTKPSPPADDVMMYEAYDKWTRGINVGFTDGHVDFVTNEAQFQQMLKRTQERNAGK